MFVMDGISDVLKGMCGVFSMGQMVKLTQKLATVLLIYVYVAMIRME